VEGPPGRTALPSTLRLAVRPLDPPGPGSPQDLRPGADGRYQVAPPAGRYEVTADAEGYLGERKGPAGVLAGALTGGELRPVPPPARGDARSAPRPRASSRRRRASRSTTARTRRPSS